MNAPGSDGAASVDESPAQKGPRLSLSAQVFIARLAPIGVFALIASAAGTLDIDALGRLQVYILTYIGAAVLLPFWIMCALCVAYPLARAIP